MKKIQIQKVYKKTHKHNDLFDFKNKKLTKTIGYIGLAFIPGNLIQAIIQRDIFIFWEANVGFALLFSLYFITKGHSRGTGK